MSKLTCWLGSYIELYWIWHRGLMYNCTISSFKRGRNHEDIHLRRFQTINVNRMRIITEARNWKHQSVYSVHNRWCFKISDDRKERTSYRECVNEQPVTAFSVPAFWVVFQAKRCVITQTEKKSIEDVSETSESIGVYGLGERFIFWTVASNNDWRNCRFSDTSENWIWENRIVCG